MRTTAGARVAARAGTPPVREHIVTDATESFLWRRDDYPWERNVWNIHPEYEIHLVRNAGGVALVGDHIEPFEPGYLAIVGSGLPHDWVTTTAPGEVIQGRDIVLQFDAGRLRDAASVFPELRAVDTFLTLALRGLAFEGAARQEGAALLEAMGPIRGPERLALFIRLIAVLMRGDHRVLSSVDFPLAAADGAHSPFPAVLSYIRENFQSQEIGLAALALHFRMSPWGFSRFFKKNSGLSLTDYLTSLRISHACQLLAETTMPITDICFEIGYSNVSNFNRTFQRLRGMPPSRYRRHAQKRITQRGASGTARLVDTSLRTA